MTNKNQNDELRVARSALDMSPGEFRRLGHRLIDVIATFYESFGERRLTRAAEPGEIRALLGTGELPETGEDAETLLAEVAPLLFDNSLHNGHPKFLGYITSSAAPLGALADLLASALNANVGKWDLSPVASEIETQAVRWLADFIGYERDCSGSMVSGGNMANFVGFLAARQAMANWDIRSEGLHPESVWLRFDGAAKMPDLSMREKSVIRSAVHAWHPPITIVRRNLIHQQSF